MPESRIHIHDAIVTIKGHHTLSLRSRRFCCIRRNGAAHGSLACDLLQMGALVEGGIICAVAASQVGPRPRTVAGQDTRHCIRAFRLYSSCAVGIHPLLPVTFGKGSQACCRNSKLDECNGDFSPVMPLGDSPTVGDVTHVTDRTCSSA